MGFSRQEYWSGVPLPAEVGGTQMKRNFVYLSGGSDTEESTCNAGDMGSVPGSGRSPGGGNGNPLQCSCLENPRDGGAWWAAVYGVAQSRTRLKRLSSSSSSRLQLGKYPSSERRSVAFNTPFKSHHRIQQ